MGVNLEKKKLANKKCLLDPINLANFLHLGFFIFGLWLPVLHGYGVISLGVKGLVFIVSYNAFLVLIDLIAFIFLSIIGISYHLFKKGEELPKSFYFCVPFAVWFIFFALPYDSDAETFKEMITPIFVGVWKLFFNTLSELNFF